MHILERNEYPCGVLIGKRRPQSLLATRQGRAWNNPLYATNSTNQRLRDPRGVSDTECFQHGLDHTILVKVASTTVTSWLLGLFELESLAALSQALARRPPSPNLSPGPEIEWHQRFYAIMTTPFDIRFPIGHSGNNDTSDHIREKFRTNMMRMRFKEGKAEEVCGRKRWYGCPWFIDLFVKERRERQSWSRDSKVRTSPFSNLHFP